MQKIFPILLIILDILAAIIYLCFGDIKRCVYWIAATVLTITVTF